MRNRKRTGAVLVALALVLSLLLLWFLLEDQEDFPPAQLAMVQQEEPSAASETLSLLFIDVGQADSILLRCGGASMLVDGGNAADSDTVATVLKKQGVDHLDYVVCTHAHEDHAGGLAGALHQARADHVLAPVADASNKPFQNFKRAAEEQGLSIAIPAPGDTIALSGASVQVLGPRKTYEQTNNTSIVLMVTFGDTRFLLTGDMERNAEKDLLEAGCDLHADLLKVGHHGSSSSTSYAFLNQVMPAYAVMEVGADNDYGHPSRDTLSRLRDANVKLYRTDLQGDILAESDGKRVTVTVARNANVETNPTVNGDDAPLYYIGNTSSRKFHRPTCSGLPAEDKRVWFGLREEAVAAGYEPCSRCKP